LSSEPLLALEFGSLGGLLEIRGPYRLHMILTTKRKIALAAIAYQTLAAGRFLIGKNDHAVVRRGGFKWDLDLREGIDFAIYLLGAFEKSTVATLQRLVELGDVVLDIGANIGAHTLSLARSAGPTGHVFAIEPTDFAFTKLKRNIALNPEFEARIHASQVLLVGEPNAPRQPEIYASWPLKTEDCVHPKHGGRLAVTRHAAVKTLDDFFRGLGLDRLDVIKMDVDGHEYPVLKGGANTLARFQPTLVMEMSPYIHAEENYSFEDLVQLLRDCRYSLQDATAWRPVPLHAQQLRELIPDGSSINVIARPGPGNGLSRKGN
jgi:FkbM family methyltransferase